MTSPERRLKLLVVDDAELVREVLCEQLRLLGHEAIAAENGEQALALYLDLCPDVVLMDWVMPVMDGMTATRAIRALPGAHWVPIIMLSAHGEESEYVNALRNGCDDYLVKPVKLPVLEAKIYALQRIAEMHNEIERSQHELQQFYEQAEEEFELARYIMTRLVRSKASYGEGETDLLPVKGWLQPASQLSGDIVLYAPTEKGYCVMLADATGHGLSAAITLIPVVNVFYAMTAKGFGVASIVEEMNRQVRTVCPIERFVAIALIGIDAREHVIEVWNGGIPPLQLLDEHGEPIHRFLSRNLPLGIVGERDFKNMPEYHRFDRPLQLLAYTDGLPEAGEPEAFGNERILAAMRAVPTAQRLAVLRQAFVDFIGSARQRDDITAVLIECPLASVVSNRTQALAKPAVPRVRGDWSLQTTLSAQQLKTIDFVPMVVDWAHAMGLPREQGSTFFLVVTELFVNALEHGLLELSSHLKLESNGFERFVALRQQRLAALVEGEIFVGLTSRATPDGTVVGIHMRDSGRGFATEPCNGSGLGGNQAPSGRGIALVKKFCRTLEYRGCGNEVYAELVW